MVFFSHQQIKAVFSLLLFNFLTGLHPAPNGSVMMKLFDKTAYACNKNLNIFGNCLAASGVFRFFDNSISDALKTAVILIIVK